MNWKYLIPLPLAAILLGERVHVPQRLPALPVSAGTGCDYKAGRKMYLLAWAYRRDQPEAARKLARGAEQELASCHGDLTVLRERIRMLRENLSL